MSISYFESAGINTVPMFLSAKSPRRLRRLMLRNNLRHKGFVKYLSDPKWVDRDKLWYVWFYVDIEKEPVDGDN